MSIYAIVIATAFATGNALNVSVNIVPVPGGKPACELLLKDAVDGMRETYIGNAMAAGAEVKTSLESGWTVVRTPVGRVLGRVKCTRLDAAGDESARSNKHEGKKSSD